MPSRFSRWPFKPRLDDEVDEEIAFHLEMRTREYIERGLDPAAARGEAERRFGDLRRMRSTLRTLGHRRDEHMKRTQYVAELWQDLTFTARQLLKNRSFAAIAILTLALGIGGTTAIFSALYAVVLQPIALRDPERLVLVAETFQGAPGGVSVGNYVDATAATRTFAGLAAEQNASFNLSDGVTPERIVGARVSANYFDVLGAAPEIGRTFTPAEDRPGSETVVVLSHRFWTRRFGASPQVIGQTVRMNGATYSIVGVMPASFDLTADSDELWVPIAFTPAQRAMHDEHFLNVYGRLRPGAAREQALSELNAIAMRVRREFPRDAIDLTFMIVPFRDQFVGDYRTRLLVLLAAVSVVLLIACGNVANLLLARGSTRGREIAVRTALGAGQWRIVRQLLTESVVLALIAAAAGLLLARWAIATVVAFSPPGVPRLEQAHIDPVVLAFAIVLALASSVLCGIAPALRLARAPGRDIQSGLRDGGRGVTGGGLRDRLRSGLIVAEVALSLLLLFGAGLLIRSAVALQRVNLGIDPTGVLTARFTLPETTYGDPRRESEALRRINEAASQIRGASAAAVTSFAAMGGGGGTNGLVPEGASFDIRSAIPSVLRLTTPGFFAVMQTPIVKGRGFSEHDRAGGQKVMIVSAALAARAFPGQDPIGRRIACCEPGPNGGPDWKIVIGVAGDIRSRGPAVEPRPEFYLPMAQAPDDAWRWFRTFYVVVKSSGDPLASIEPLRAAMASVDPDVPLFDVRTMNQRLAGSLAVARFNTLLLSILGGIGLLLAASGIYGVIAYFVTARRQEIGVRIALGASPGMVVRLVLVQALRPVALGTAIGIGSAAIAGRALSGQLFGVTRTDPLTMAAVVATLIGVALVASAVPARRAAAVDPTRALQSE